MDFTYERCNMIPGYQEWLETVENDNISKMYEEYLAENDKSWIYDHEEHELEVMMATA